MSIGKLREMGQRPPLDLESLQKFWEEQADNIAWFKKWRKSLVWNEPFAQWFVGGTLNASYACVDVHIKSGRGDVVAFYWQTEQGQIRNVTYNDLYQMVNNFASCLQNMGVGKGDIIVLYLPMIPEAIAMMLACARIGAIHAVVFSGFSAHALLDRINDTKAKFVVTADKGVRRGKLIDLKKVVDDAVESSTTVEKVLVVKRFSQPMTLVQGRDILLADALHEAADYVAPVAVDAQHPLFILYTSGTTGKPKGLMHSTGGYLTYVYSTFKWAFNVQQDSVYWCAADIGWITGHSYITYAPLLHGITQVMYEGVPNYPDPGVWWRLVEKYKVSIFYTSPTALRMCKKEGSEWAGQADLSSLKTLGSVGEPINPEVWEWYHDVIGDKNCPIIDTWWQTETGGFMIAPTHGLDLVSLKPGSATLALPGIDAQVVDTFGKEVSSDVKGFLVIKKPWPGMTIGIFGDNERFKQVYWSKFKGCYYSGDYAIKDADGYFWLLGRADEVLNIAGHRIGTAEIENAAIEHSSVAEAAAIGVKDDIRGEEIVLFVSIKGTLINTKALQKDIIATIQKAIGKFVKPKDVYFVEKLPKTRSGKIMRRLLKAVVEGRDIGDVSTLEDSTTVFELRKRCLQLKTVVG